MAFDVNVIFTGLVMLCMAPDEPCPKQSMAYLVNATAEQKVCGRPMDGDHRARLAFDSRFLLPGATLDYRIEPAPDGRRSVVASLEGVELCIRVQDRSGNTSPLGSPPEHRRGGSYSNHPETLLADYYAYDWIAYLPMVDPRLAQTKFCPQVDKPLVDGSGTPDNAFVISRTRIEGGTLMTQGCARHDKGFMSRLLANDYILWEVEHDSEDSQYETDFPKALADQVVWRSKGIASDRVILLQSCGSDPQTFFALDTEGRDLDLHISNLPPKKVLSAPGPHLDHFRWFYWLYDWDENGCQTAKACPRDIAVPRMPTHHSFGDSLMWGVTSETIHCPPAGSGSGG